MPFGNFRKFVYLLYYCNKKFLLLSTILLLSNLCRFRLSVILRSWFVKFTYYRRIYPSYRATYFFPPVYSLYNSLWLTNLNSRPLLNMEQRSNSVIHLPHVNYSPRALFSVLFRPPQPLLILNIYWDKSGLYRYSIGSLVSSPVHLCTKTSSFLSRLRDLFFSEFFRKTRTNQ